MPLSLAEVRDLLARRAAGEALTPAQQADLVRSARSLKRRLARLQAIDPSAFAEVELHQELEALAQPEVLTGSA